MSKTGFKSKNNFNHKQRKQESGKKKGGGRKDDDDESENKDKERVKPSMKDNANQKEYSYV